MTPTFRYQRGDLIADVQLQGAPYRVVRRLRDEDTDAALYVIQRLLPGPDTKCCFSYP